MEVEDAGEVPVRDRFLLGRIQLLLKAGQDDLSTLSESPNLGSNGEGTEGRCRGCILETHRG